MLADTSPIQSPADCRLASRQLYEYWQSKRRGRVMPRRADIDPTEIDPHVLPSISMVEVVADERRYVYRLAGTNDVQVRGYDPTGRSVSECFFGPSAADSIACYDRVVALKTPMLDPTSLQNADGRYIAEDTIFLPLSDDGVNVNKILVHFSSRPTTRL